MIEKSDLLAKEFFDKKLFNLAAMQSEITVAMQPDSFAAYFNSGRCHYYNNKYDLALDRMYKCLEINPDFIEAKRELALYYTWLGDLEKAKEISDLLPNDASKNFNEGWHKLRENKFHEGMCLIESGRSSRLWGNADLKLLTPKWDNQSLVDKTILIVTEAGLGDEIIFARFVKHFKSIKAKNIIVACNPSLMSLFSRIDGVDVVVSNTGFAPKHDFWIPAMSIPAVAKIHNPEKTPYLSPSPEYVKKWQKKLNFSDKPKIAIRWRGNQLFEHDQKRTLDPEVMFNELKNFGVIYSVQKDCPCPRGIINLADELETWEDTAAVLSLMDCVVSSCTSVPHLSGAMGVPTVVVVPIVSYFTWAFPSEESIWYESVKIARQTTPYDWNDAYKEMVELTAQSLKNNVKKEQYAHSNFKNLSK